MTGEQRTASRGYWFPLLLFGGLAALSLPLSALMSPRLPERVWLFRVVYPNVAEVLYLGGGSVGPPFPFPLGWYWAGTLAAGAPVVPAVPGHGQQHAAFGPFFSPFEDPAVLLPAAVLVFAGAGVLAAGAVRRWRAGPS